MKMFVRREIKRCTCCQASYTESQWSALRSIGTMSDGEGGTLGLRNCRCGSTLAVELVMMVSA